MQQHGSKCSILPVDPLPRLWGSKGRNLTFSEHDHVAYQIKWNHECNNMVANILPVDPLPGPWGQKVEIQIFKNMVMLHIKLKRITNAATW